MKISEIGKQKKLPNQAPVSPKKGQVFALKRIKVSTDVVLWLVFLGVVIVESIAAFNFLYKNLLFKQEDVSAASSAIVRVNFENYEKVINRLDRVYLFTPGADIDFSGKEEGIGRDNPFSDPE